MNPDSTRGVSCLTLPFLDTVNKGMLAMVEASATEISPVGIPDVVFLFLVNFLSAGFTSHVFIPPDHYSKYYTKIMN